MLVWENEFLEPRLLFDISEMMTKKLRATFLSKPAQKYIQRPEFQLPRADIVRITSGGLVYLSQLTFLSAAVALVAAPQDSGQAIDTQRSSIAIHVGKSGLFAAAAHQHWVDAPIASGTIDAAGATPS